MAKGKSKKASVASRGSAKKAKPAAKSAKTKGKKVAGKALGPTPNLLPPPPPVIKKKNVKRGAPPILPRRRGTRPTGPPPGTPVPPPRQTVAGSLHMPVTTPTGADDLRQRLSAVNALLSTLRGLKRTLQRQFFEAGLILQKLSDSALFEAKGYGSFEKFIEREIERELSIGRATVNDLVNIVRLFHREAAEELGFEKLRAALRVLYPEQVSPPAAAGTLTS